MQKKFFKRSLPLWFLPWYELLFFKNTNFKVPNYFLHSSPFSTFLKGGGGGIYEFKALFLLNLKAFNYEQYARMLNKFGCYKSTYNKKIEFVVNVKTNYTMSPLLWTKNLKLLLEFIFWTEETPQLILKLRFFYGKTYF